MMFSYIFRNTGRNSGRILTKLGMMNDYRLGMMPIVGRYGPVITAVLVDWFLRLKYGVSCTFRNTGRNSSRILTKLGMMNDCGSGMMPIVGRYGPVITTVLVDLFLCLKYGVFVYFVQ